MAQLCSRRMGFQSSLRTGGTSSSYVPPRSFERSASAPHTVSCCAVELLARRVRKLSSLLLARTTRPRAGPATELSGASRGPSSGG